MTDVITDYLPLSQAADTTHRSEHSLVHLGAMGQLALYVRVVSRRVQQFDVDAGADGQAFAFPCGEPFMLDGLLRLSNNDAARLEISGEYVVVDTFSGFEHLVPPINMSLSKSAPPKPICPSDLPVKLFGEPLVITPRNLMILPQDLSRITKSSASHALTKDSVLVVRTIAQREFEQPINGTSASPEKPLTTNERNTLLTIIAALCDYSAIKYQERGAAGQIVKMTEEIGAAVTDDTIRKVLAKIPEALETRMK